MRQGTLTDRAGACSVIVAVALGLGFVGWSPATAQSAMAGGARVQVPPVAELELEPVATFAAGAAAGGATLEGSVRLRVRANHDWQVVMAAPATSGGTLWVRAVSSDGSGESGEFRRVEAGVEFLLVDGGRGETVVRVDYRWTGRGGLDRGVAPLTYTLASL